MKYQISPEQSYVIDWLYKIMENKRPSEHKVAVLTGSAGTGKTTCINEVVNKFIYNNYEVFLTATTHKAADVITDILTTYNVNSASTIHSLFNLRPSVTNTGKEVIKTIGAPKVLRNSIVIIDEASMINEELFKIIANIAKELSLFIIFVGDPYQLPPVTGNCKIFDGSLPIFKLTKVFRQQNDNPILTKAIEYRDYIEGTTTVEPTIITDKNINNEGINILNHKDFCATYVANHLDYTIGAPVKYPLCTYTNISAMEYNNLIRTTKYFLEGTVEPFYKGERLIANKTITTLPAQTGGFSRNTPTILIPNNEEVIVKDYFKSTLVNLNCDIGNTLFNLPIYYITVSTSKDVVTVPCYINIEDIKTHQDYLKSLVLNNSIDFSWLDYYNLLGNMADLRPPFAGTVHKAQGGTFDKVFIDKKNIDTCRDSKVRAKLMYVALTRARKEIYINA